MKTPIIRFRLFSERHARHVDVPVGFSTMPAKHVRTAIARRLGMQQSVESGKDALRIYSDEAGTVELKDDAPVYMYASIVVRRLPGPKYYGRNQHRDIGAPAAPSVPKKAMYAFQRPKRYDRPYRPPIYAFHALSRTQ